MQGENQYDSQSIEPQTQPESAPVANGQDDDVIEVVTVIKSCAYDPLTRL